MNLAVKEARKRSIKIHAMITDSGGSSQLPTMFGKNHFQILSGANDLAESLTEFYSKIAASLY